MKKIILATLLLSLSLSAQTIKLKTLKNETLNITNYEGNFIFEDAKYNKKNILLFFFGTNCHYCIKEIPDINKLNKNRTDLEVLGIHAEYEISDKKLKTFIKDKNIKFEVFSYIDGITWVKYLKSINMWIGAVPFYVLIDKHGNLEAMEFLEVMSKEY